MNSISLDKTPLQYNIQATNGLCCNTFGLDTPCNMPEFFKEKIIINIGCKDICSRIGIEFSWEMGFVITFLQNKMLLWTQELSKL